MSASRVRTPLALVVGALARHERDLRASGSVWAAFAVVGMNAHINVDLPQALLAVISEGGFAARRCWSRAGATTSGLTGSCCHASVPRTTNSTARGPWVWRGPSAGRVARPELGWTHRSRRMTVRPGQPACFADKVSLAGVDSEVAHPSPR